MQKVLTIAGSDSGGCAGIQADIKTISALGCFATSAITAITAQNTLGVQNIAIVAPAIIAAQIDAVLSDIGADAIKIGMLADSATINVVAETLRKYPGIPIVHDPVMVATSGDVLMPAAVNAQLLETLLVHATIITPNYAEACLLAGLDMQEQPSPDEIAACLTKLTTAAVLITGGDAYLTTDQAIDYLYYQDTKKTYTNPKIVTINTHGTGCTMSSAIASYLALGNSLEQAVSLAKSYISQAILHGAKRTIGAGSGPVDHFHTI